MNRGIRNNNPLNIRISKSEWKGRVLNNTDGTFEQFISMYYGFRAAIRLIENYILRYRCNTIEQIISRWAPPTENNTEQYITHVCQMSGIGGREPLSNHDPRLKEIVRAMAIIESGQEINQYSQQLDSAFEDFTPQSIYENHGRGVAGK